MPGLITVLWLTDDGDIPARQDERYRHVTGDPARPGATITSLLSEGAVLAVVRNELEAERAIAYGADETVLASDALGEAFERAVSRTAARARARLHRDLFLIDLVRKDDTMALELLAAALGEELAGPLSRASAESRVVVEELGEDGRTRRMRSIAETVAGAAEVVERMRELVHSGPTDEVVDLARVAHEVATSLAPAIRRVASLELSVVDRRCEVGMPRWQIAVLVAGLVANAVESVGARGGRDRKVSVRVSIEEGAAAVLEVSDNRLGMGEDDRAHALDPFFTTTGKGQLGLGLTLSSARVRRAGGSLIIESDEGVGTTVRVFLPLVGGHTSLPSN